jgi:ATP-dependent DNA helicase RecQ
LEVPRVLALTATATPKVSRSICEAFEIDASASVNTGFYRPNLKFCLTPVPGEKRADLLVSRLTKRPKGSGIVYVTLQKTAQEIAGFLNENGVEARAYHAGMDSILRSETQEWWMESPARIVVATIAFGMGIDKSDVRYVYHFNLPKGLENYSQEIGTRGPRWFAVDCGTSGVPGRCADAGKLRLRRHAYAGKLARLRRRNSESGRRFFHQGTRFERAPRFAPRS